MSHKLLLDLDVIFDVYNQLRRESFPRSVELLNLIDSNNSALAYISSSAFDNLYFVKYKEFQTQFPHYTKKQCSLVIKEFIKELQQKYKVAKTPSYIELDFDNIEDSQMLASAKAVGAKLVTRDQRLLTKYTDETISVKSAICLLTTSVPVQFIDLKKQYEYLQPKIEKQIDTVLNHGQYVMGPEVVALESSLAKYTGTKHCVSCSSGTDALVMALMALGIGEGDIVMTTPFTFIATAEAIKFVGATPLFIDIDIDTFNMSPLLLETALKAITENKATIHSKICTDITTVKAIISVDLFGLPADAEKINKIAQDFGLFVIEDAAQGFGGSINGNKAGSLADVGCTSFFPAKPLGCYGDGGAIFTDNDELAEKLKSIRVHGQGTDKYQNVRLGLTGRLDTMQAAILLPKLAVFDTEIEQRQNVAKLYTKSLSNINGLITPTVPHGYVSAWAQYTLMARDDSQRTRIIEHLKSNGIPVAVYYPIPLHEQKVFKKLGYSSDDFKVSSSAANRVFSLPMHPYLEPKDIDAICNLIEAM